MEREIETGKMIVEDGKYFLEVGRQRMELSPAALGGETPARELAGAQVEVLLSEPVRQVIAIIPRRPLRPILCYVPPPDIFRRFKELGPIREIAQQPTLQLHPPICYVPADWLVKGIEEKVRQNLASRLLQEGVISKAVHDKLA